MQTTSVLCNMWSARMSRQEYALHTRQEATKTNGTPLTESRAKNDLKTAWIYPKIKNFEKNVKHNKMKKNNTGSKIVLSLKVGPTPSGPRPRKKIGIFNSK